MKLSQYATRYLNNKWHKVKNNEIEDNLPPVWAGDGVKYKIKEAAKCNCDGWREIKKENKDECDCKCACEYGPKQKEKHCSGKMCCVKYKSTPYDLLP